MFRWLPEDPGRRRAGQSRERSLGTSAARQYLTSFSLNAESAGESSIVTRFRPSTISFTLEPEFALGGHPTAAFGFSVLAAPSDDQISP